MGEVPLSDLTRALQARGKPRDAEREVRALLDLLRENAADVRANMLLACQDLLCEASSKLKILNTKRGNKEGDKQLIKSLAVEMERLIAPG